MKYSVQLELVFEAESEKEVMEKVSEIECYDYYINAIEEKEYDDERI